MPECERCEQVRNEAYDVGYDDGYEQGVEDAVDKAIGFIQQMPPELDLEDLIKFLEGEKSFDGTDLE